MINVTEPVDLRITCAPRMAELLAAELEELGWTVSQSAATYVTVHASFEDAFQLNLLLRTAFNVLYPLNAFRCSEPLALYDAVNDMGWEDLISPDESISIVSSVNTPTISDWRFASLKVKDAIVDRISDAVGRRPDSGAKRENVVIHLYWHGEHAEVFLNTSGRKLSDRNYRKIPHKAPMQESLAAGVVMATGYDGTCPFVNPMCGSGTLAIEAALIASGRVPGLLRSNFGMMHVRCFDHDKWQALRNQVRKVRGKDGPAPIVASDHDEKAIRAARKNAETAGVHRLIDFHVCDFTETPIPDSPGIVLLNPEYGERLGELKALEETYGRIGDFFKQRCTGWTGYVFTGNLDLAKKIGLRASRRREFYNAKIDCRLLRYEMYKGTRRTNL
ncbi:MAG: THUMP domain-containing class I SAM-dependent RNA methyltransferase [Planctomycetota bacterium]|jgi:putative N6-adenine-specific DNA methylase